MIEDLDEQDRQMGAPLLENSLNPLKINSDATQKDEAWETAETTVKGYETLSKSKFSFGQKPFAITKEFVKKTAKEAGCCGLSFCLLLVALIMLGCSLFFSYSRIFARENTTKCSTGCRYYFVETIPLQTETEFKPVAQNTMQTHLAWLEMINSATKSIKMAGYYFSLLNTEKVEGADRGNAFIDAIVAAKNRGIKIEVIVNSPSLYMDDLHKFQSAGIDIVNFNWGKMFDGQGILHSKLMIVDDHSFYVGSSNFDWRSISHVKELGVYVKNCPCLKDDIEKIFQIYKYIGDEKDGLNSTFINFRGYPQHTDTEINNKKPLAVPFQMTGSEETGKVYISSAPSTVNTDKRTNDIDAVLEVINSAKETLNLAVMNVYPIKMYVSPHEKDQKKQARFFWDEMETSLKNAMMKNVKVNLLVSNWDQTEYGQFVVLASLEKYGQFCLNMRKKGEKGWCSGSINVKILDIPKYVDPDTKEPIKIEYARVGHSKFIVSDSQALVSTSNWSWDYFYTTGGISFVSDQKSFVGGVNDIFNRDWNSAYAKPLSDFL